MSRPAKGFRRDTPGSAIPLVPQRSHFSVGTVPEFRVLGFGEVRPPPPDRLEVVSTFYPSPVHATIGIDLITGS